MLERGFSDSVRRGLIQKGDRILVGVSGGPDSMALLNLLTSLQDSLQIVLGVAHIQYSIRVEESKKEALWLSSFVEKKGLAFYLKQSSLNSNQSNVQAKARKIRYQFFQEIIKKENYNKLALAHHLDDQIETFFFKLFFRKTPLLGLSAMREKTQRRTQKSLSDHSVCSSFDHTLGSPAENFMANRPCIDSSEDQIQSFSRDFCLIRPLLKYPKSEIMDYLKLRRLKYFIDSSNQKKYYSRNQIRHEILTPLEKLIPSYRKSFTSLLDEIESLRSWMESFLDEKEKNIETIDSVTKEPNKETTKKKIPLKSTKPVSSKLLPSKPTKRVLDRNRLKQEAEWIQKALLERIVLGIQKQNLSQSAQNVILQALEKKESGTQVLWEGKILKIYLEYSKLIFEKKQKSKILQVPSIDKNYNPSIDSSLAQNIPFQWKVTKIKHPKNISSLIEQAKKEQAKKKSMVLFLEEEEFFYGYKVLDTKALTSCLFLRSPKKGERILLSSKTGKKKVKEILINAKIPKEKRKEVLLFCKSLPSDLSEPKQKKEENKGNNEEVLAIFFPYPIEHFRLCEKFYIRPNKETIKENTKSNKNILKIEINFLQGLQNN